MRVSGSVSGTAYSLAGLSFEIVNSPGRLSLMEERRQYEICHLLRGHLGEIQTGHQLLPTQTRVRKQIRFVCVI